jgi:hypothetical protein
MLPINSKIILPKKNEPGSFGAVRKHDIHTGVDLYCALNEPVYAIEDGIIIGVGHFTGYDESPWWNDTDYILIRGKSGCILYGEIKVSSNLIRGAEGCIVKAGDFLGSVITVLKKDKGRPLNMLHIELYDSSYEGSGVIWNLGQPKPKELKDITPILKREMFKNKPIIKQVLHYAGIK